MWLFTNFGYFSIVQKPGTSDLTVRTRVKSDLEALRAQYLPDLGPTMGKAGSDYPWRATVPHQALAAAMSQIVMDVDYSNFKNEVAAKQGMGRSTRYHKVWDALYGMQEELSPMRRSLSRGVGEPWPNPVPVGKKLAYGGVLFDTEGRVLLREPRGHFDDYVWTFAKGRPDPGEAPEVTALREVEEETGVKAIIVAPIPGDFIGGTTLNRYFLMVPTGPIRSLPTDSPETASVCWVNPEDARALISLTKNKAGKLRDLAVLEAGIVAWAKRTS